MSSTLPTTTARRTGSPRHLAPEVAGVLRIATPEDLTRTGRHAETATRR